MLDVALRQWRVADYDRVAVLLDTDTDWDDAQRARARKAKVRVFGVRSVFGGNAAVDLKRPVPAATRTANEFRSRSGRPSAPSLACTRNALRWTRSGGKRADARAFADLAARRAGSLSGEPRQPSAAKR